MAARISGIAVAQVAAGFVLFWSGLHNTSIKATLTSFAKGQPPSPGPTQTPYLQIGAAGGGTSGSTASTGTGSPAPSAPANVSGNVAIGKLLATQYGWGSGAQWNALYALWERESGWSNTAQNQSSGAYGIAQALGHGSNGAPYPAGYSSANPPQYGGASNPSAQISWGLSYIKSTYGSAEAAWSHEQSAGWY